MQLMTTFILFASSSKRTIFISFCCNFNQLNSTIVKLSETCFRLVACAILYRLLNEGDEYVTHLDGI